MSTAVLMCPPTALPELAGDASWRPDAPPLDRERAMVQWHGLRELVDRRIAPVVLLVAEPWAPAMTFTRDLALPVDGRLVPLEPHLRRGAFERPLFERAMARLGVDLADTGAPIRIDGGAVLADTHGRLLIGALSEADPQLTDHARRLESLTRRPAHRVPVAGGRFPHLDLALCDLGSAWLAHPHALPGFDTADPSWRALLLDRPVIEVAPDDGERLACNLVIGDAVAIGPEVSVELRRRIEATGCEYLATPLDELAKAGGGAHCLTLEIPYSAPTRSSGCALS